MPITRPAAITLDARSLLPATKTGHILETFDRLQVGTALEINEETDPRALRNEMAQLRPGRFSWDARNLGGNRWTVRLERIDENAGGETFLTHVTAFTSAKAGTVKELAEQMSERTYKSGDTIFDEGEAWPYLGIVKSVGHLHAAFSGRQNAYDRRASYARYAQRERHVRYRRRDDARRSFNRRDDRHAPQRSGSSRGTQ